MKKERINCVVVTYNRLELLKENIEALSKQSCPIDKIIIINNCSTDGTKKYLEQFIDNDQFQIFNFQTNLGGSAGFSAGIKEALSNEADWIWIMDDDTIPHPDALEQLNQRTHITENIGFLASKVIWKDGTSHLMNLPAIRTLFETDGKKLPFNLFSDKGALLIGSTSFVSVLVNARAVRKVGLPYSQFFIWGDDSEFTDRIVRSGFYGLYIEKSIALHKTAENYTSDLLTAPDSVAWKFYYEIRNSMFLKRRRKKKFIPFFFSSLNRLRKDLRSVKKRRSGQEAFKKALVSGFKAGLKFKPEIEYLSGHPHH